MLAASSHHCSAAAVSETPRVVYLRGEERREQTMVEVTVAADGTIEIPAAVSKRLGIRPGTRLALDDATRDGSISLRVLPAEAQLIEKEGVWVIRAQPLHPEDKDVDWVARVRSERSACVLGDG